MQRDEVTGDADDVVGALHRDQPMPPCEPRPPFVIGDVPHDSAVYHEVSSSASVPTVPRAGMLELRPAPGRRTMHGGEMEIHLSPEESDALRSSLRTYISDLRMEIADTDNPEFRRVLRGERSVLESVLSRLEDAGRIAFEPIS